MPAGDDPSYSLIFYHSVCRLSGEERDIFGAKMSELRQREGEQVVKAEGDEQEKEDVQEPSPAVELEVEEEEVILCSYLAWRCARAPVGNCDCPSLPTSPCSRHGLVRGSRTGAGQQVPTTSHSPCPSH